MNRSRHLSLAALLLLALPLGGCFKVGFGSDQLKCSSDGKCPSGFHCVADACWKNGDGPDMSAGTGGGGGMGGALASACSHDSDCQLGHCVDGVCCNEACAGPCQACNLPDSPGMCSALAAGAAAKGGGCGPDAPTSCGHNGVCDGKGMCQLYGSDTTCASGSCDASSNLVTGDSKCDGAGKCVAPAAITCAPFKCDTAGKSCTSSCTTAADCSAPNPCVNSSCGPKELGSQCKADGDCKSSHCSSGVCCDSACTGSCTACNAAGHCANVAANQPDPKNKCVANNATCTIATCDGNGACSAAKAGTLCSFGCNNSGDTNGQWAVGAVTKKVCDGVTAGACTQVDTSTQSCGNLTCASTSACRTTCAVDSDCIVGDYCASGACTPRKANGTSCTANNQCISFTCDPNTHLCGQCVHNPSGTNNDFQHCNPNTSRCDTNDTCIGCTTFSNGTSTYSSCGGFGTAGSPANACSSNGACICSKDTDCAGGQGPFCVTGRCACTPGGQWCAWGTVCTAARACKIAAGFPCVAASDCASGTCTNGVCASPTSLTYCATSLDCPFPNAGTSCGDYQCYPGTWNTCQEGSCD
jgi:hypothetical protein